MLKRITVKNLFGSFSYDIEIPEECNPFLLTGPNGYGKTTLMCIINNLSKGNLYYFYRLPFDEIHLYTQTDAHISIISNNISSISDSQEDSVVVPERVVEFQWKSSDADAYLQLNKKTINHALRSLRLSRYDRYLHNDLQNYELYKYIKEHNDQFLDALSSDTPQKAFLMMIKSLKIQFISAQRLYITEEDKIKENIEYISQCFEEKLNNAYFKYLTNSAGRDSHFIETLLNQDDNISEATYVEKCSDLNRRIEELSKYRLVRPLSLPKYKDTKSHILAAYIKNVADNLSTYDTLLPLLQLYLQLTTEKMFVNKEIEILIEEGLRVRNLDKSIIPLRELSSGEKNILIMLYNFIFSVDSNTLLLIDEPEISLHVAWQIDFINDIKRIAEVKKLQVIIATHSPQIIGSRWNECYDLEENKYGID